MKLKSLFKTTSSTNHSCYLFTIFASFHSWQSLLLYISVNYPKYHRFITWLQVFQNAFPSFHRMEPPNTENESCSKTRILFMYKTASVKKRQKMLNVKRNNISSRSSSNILAVAISSHIWKSSEKMGLIAWQQAIFLGLVSSLSISNISGPRPIFKILTSSRPCFYLVLSIFKYF